MKVSLKDQIGFLLFVVLLLNLILIIKFKITDLLFHSLCVNPAPVLDNIAHSVDCGLAKVVGNANVNGIHLFCLLFVNITETLIDWRRK